MNTGYIPAIGSLIFSDVISTFCRGALISQNPGDVTDRTASERASKRRGAAWPTTNQNCNRVCVVWMIPPSLPPPHPPRICRDGRATSFWGKNHARWSIVSRRAETAVAVAVVARKNLRDFSESSRSRNRRKLLRVRHAILRNRGDVLPWHAQTMPREPPQSRGVKNEIWNIINPPPPSDAKRARIKIARGHAE